jgi:PAS domain S-box-containing protein
MRIRQPEIYRSITNGNPELITPNAAEYNQPVRMSYMPHRQDNKKARRRKVRSCDSLEQETMLRRQAEEELRRVNETIEAGVAAGTSELKDADTGMRNEVITFTQAEKEISLLNFALNNVREAAFLIDEKARFHFVNEESCRILGYSRDELLTLSVPDVDPDFPHTRWPVHWIELKSRRTLTFEGRHRRKDGHIFPVEINANYLEYDNKGYNLALVRDITERKQAEAERLAHLRFLQSMDQINLALMKTDDLENMLTEVLNTLLSILHCDRAWLAFPCDPQATACRVVKECTSQEYPGALSKGGEIIMDNEMVNVLMAARASNCPVTFGPGSRYRLPEALTKHFDVQSQIAMALYPKGDVSYIFGLHQCSSPRIWTEEDIILLQEAGRRLTDSLTSLLMHRSLRAREMKYRTLFEESFDGLFITSPGGKILDMNRKGIEMFGYNTIDEILSLDLEKDVYAHAPDRKRILKMVNELGSAEYEITVKKKSGELMDTLCSLTAEKDETGKTLSYRGIIRDITARRQREKELDIYRERLEELVRERTLQLEQSENLYRSLFTTMTEGFALHEIILDEQGMPVDYRFIDANQAFEHLTGLSRERIIGRTIKEILPDIEQYWIETYGCVALTGQPVHFERHSETLGREYEVYAYKSAPGQFATIFKDITERKQGEERIRELNRELRSRAAALEEANEDLEAFVSSISHDLRAPLRQIDGFIELLRCDSADALSAKSRHYMNTIVESAIRMSTMLDDLLSFSRMSRQEMQRAPVNLDSLIYEVIHGMEFETLGRNINWSISHLPDVTGDRSMLHIVFNNLISNALKFTKPRKKAVIEIGFTMENDDYITVFIRDNGVGFDMRYSDRLFGVFQRLHREEEFEGCGIGLANIRRIIGRHGGKTWAEGEVDKGASFYFSLPK